MARDRLPGLARAVEAAALDRDADAAATFADAGGALAELVASVAGRIDLGPEPVDLVLVGGVWDTAAPELLALDSAPTSRRSCPGRASPARPSSRPSAPRCWRDSSTGPGAPARPA